MSTARQLYRLQEIELEIDSCQRTLDGVSCRIGNREFLAGVEAKLGAEEQRLKDLKSGQQSSEWEAEDIRSKLKTAEADLYSGRIKSPKELSSLQGEVEVMKKKLSHVEDSALQFMEQAEEVIGSVAAVRKEFDSAEAAWKEEQKTLSAQKSQLETRLVELKKERGTTLAQLAPETVSLYNDLKKKKGLAVARVEQGICKSCRIQLPSADIARVRGGRLVQCGSCGRIMYLP